MPPAPNPRPFTVRHDGGSVVAVLFLLALNPLTLRCDAQVPSPVPFIVQNARSNFTPSMSILVIILFTIFSILVLFVLYIRQRASQRHAAAAAEVGGFLSWPRQHGRTGLSPEVLAALPTMTYVEAKALKMGVGTLECAVCICEFEDEETLRVLPGCCHVFHTDCINAWLASHITCPVCRSDLATAADAIAAAAAAAAADGPDPAPADGESSPAVGTAAPPPDHVVVVDAEPAGAEGAVDSARTESEPRRQQLAMLARSLSAGNFVPLPEAVEHVDRYTLRIPEHVRRQIFAARHFRRSASYSVCPVAACPVAEDCNTRSGGSCRGVWGLRLGWSERWSMPFLRTLPVTFPPWKKADSEEGSTKKEAAEGPSAVRFRAVRSSFDWLIGFGTTASGRGREINNINNNNDGGN